MISRSPVEAAWSVQKAARLKAYDCLTFQYLMRWMYVASKLSPGLHQRVVVVHLSLRWFTCCYTTWVSQPPVSVQRGALVLRVKKKPYDPPSNVRRLRVNDFTSFTDDAVTGELMFAHSVSACSRWDFTHVDFAPLLHLRTWTFSRQNAVFLCYY